VAHGKAGPWVIAKWVAGLDIAGWGGWG
jgi:hypothetical protein